MNAITKVETSGAALMPGNLREAMDLATMMAKSKLVPAALQSSPADCLLVIEQAARWGMSPFAVAQEVSVIQGKMMFSGKIVAAAIHTSGVLEGRLAYTYNGTAADLSVHVSGLLRGEAEPRAVDVTLASAKTNNQHWTKSPEQMLAYHAARVWARRHAPEVMLGVYAPEEFDDRTPTLLQREASISPKAELDRVLGGDTIPALDDAAQYQPPSRQLTHADHGVALPDQPQDNAALYASKLKRRFRECQIIEDYNEIIQDPKVREGLQRLLDKRPELWREVDAVRQEVLDAMVDQGAGGEP